MTSSASGAGVGNPTVTPVAPTVTIHHTGGGSNAAVVQPPRLPIPSELLDARREFAVALFELRRANETVSLENSSRTQQSAGASPQDLTYQRKVEQVRQQASAAQKQAQSTFDAARDALKAAKDAYQVEAKRFDTARALIDKTMAGPVEGRPPPQDKKFVKLLSGVVQILQSSAVSGVAWGARVAIQQAMARIILEALNEGEPAPDPLTPQGAAQMAFAQSMAAFATSQFVGVAHGTVENLCNAVRRVLNLVARCTVGYNVLGNAQTNPRFVDDQAAALPRGWGWSSGMRAAYAVWTAGGPAAVSLEDVFANDIAASVALTVAIGTGVQGAPFYAALGREQPGLIPQLPPGNLVRNELDNVWERSRAAFTAESKALGAHLPMPRGVAQGLLSTAIYLLNESGAPVLVTAPLALVGTALLHTERIALFMANKKLNEKLDNALVLGEGVCMAEAQQFFFSTMMVSLLESIRHIPLSPTDVHTAESHDVAMQLLIATGVVVAGEGVRRGGIWVAHRTGLDSSVQPDSKAAAALDNVGQGAVAVAATYAGGPAAGLIAAALRPMWMVLKRGFEDCLHHRHRDQAYHALAPSDQWSEGLDARVAESKLESKAETEAESKSGAIQVTAATGASSTQDVSISVSLPPQGGELHPSASIGPSELRPIPNLIPPQRPAPRRPVDHSTIPNSTTGSSTLTTAGATRSLSGGSRSGATGQGFMPLGDEKN